MKMSKKFSWSAFVVCALVALAVHWLVFEMRYMWYVTVEDANFMRSIYAACAAGILLLWAFFPSRIAVVLVGIFALFFPHLFFSAHARPLLGRSIDLPDLGIALIAIVLLFLATHLRRLTTVQSNGSSSLRGPP